jgi:acetyl esterase/lipase
VARIDHYSLFTFLSILVLVQDVSLNILNFLLAKIPLALALAFAFAKRLPAQKRLPPQQPLPWGIILTIIGLSINVWSVIPAPNMTLLPLSVAAPELSIWLLCFSSIGLASYVVSFHQSAKVLKWVGIGLSVINIIISASPLVQLSGTIDRANAAMANTFGVNYLSGISPEVRSTFRSPPYSIRAALQGIDLETPIRIHRNIEFAAPAGVSLKLNLYQPPIQGKYPTVIQIYGGGWRFGTPDSNEDFSRYLAARGYVVVAIDYRHAPKYHFPAQLIDIRAALDYIKVPDPIDSRQVLRDFLGGTPTELPDLYRQASPYQVVDRKQIPSLLIYGGKDHLVEVRYGKKLADRLRSLDTPTVYIEIPWANHAFDEIFNGTSNQVALYYTERFLAQALK